MNDQFCRCPFCLLEKRSYSKFWNHHSGQRHRASDVWSTEMYGVRSTETWIFCGAREFNSFRIRSHQLLSFLINHPLLCFLCVIAFALGFKLGLWSTRSQTMVAPILWDHWPYRILSCMTLYQKWKCEYIQYQLLATVRLLIPFLQGAPLFFRSSIRSDLCWFKVNLSFSIMFCFAF